MVREKTSEQNDSDILQNINAKLEKLPSMEKKLNQVLAVVESQKLKITELEKKIDSQAEHNKKLQDSLEKSNEMIEELQQRSRLNNIIVNGVKQVKGENVYKLIENLGKKLNIQDCMKDVQIAHRVNTTKTDKVKPIIVRLTNSSARDRWTSAFRSKRLYTEGLYVNEHLTKKNQELLYKVKNFKVTNNYKFVWVKDCKILIRKDESSRIFVIRKEEDLQRIVPSLPTPALGNDVMETSSFSKY